MEMDSASSTLVSLDADQSLRLMEQEAWVREHQPCARDESGGGGGGDGELRSTATFVPRLPGGPAVGAAGLRAVRDVRNGAAAAAATAALAELSLAGSSSPAPLTPTSATLTAAAAALVGHTSPAPPPAPLGHSQWHDWSQGRSRGMSMDSTRQQPMVD
jgi:hypothetical protein